ncbi:UNVERIFIED_CONTAM: hypothetical protein HDU68_006140 [Siphonaria sp. JEL0065]|nr:hypothetical protein HDU68_006140 [Siphonaria sp. JEL0065]
MNTERGLTSGHRSVVSVSAQTSSLAANAKVLSAGDAFAVASAAKVLSRSPSSSSSASGVSVLLDALKAAEHPDAIVRAVASAVSASSSSTISTNVFVKMVQARGDVWAAVLDEIYDALDEKRATHEHWVFVRFVFLNPELSPQGVAADLTAHLLDNVAAYTEGSVEIVALLLDVVKASPALTATPLDIDMITILEGLARSAALVDETSRTDLILCTLSTATDLLANNVSILRPLRLLHKLILASDAPLALALIVSIAASYLLLTSADLGKERLVIVSIIETCLSSFTDADPSSLDFVKRLAFGCAVYPVTCLVSELTAFDDGVSQKLRDSAFRVLEIVAGNSVDAVDAAEEGRVNILQEVEGYTNEYPGHLGAILGSIYKFCVAWTQGAIGGSPLSLYYTSETTALKPLLLTAFLFHETESTRSKAITLIKSLIPNPPLHQQPNSTTSQSKFALSILPLTLYTLKHDSSPLIQHSLLTSLLPALVSGHTDPYVTTSVLRVMTSFLGPLTSTTIHSSTATTDIQTPVLSAIGIRVLVQVWKSQPRTWPHLKNVLNGWVVRKKNRSIALKRFGKRGDGVGKGMEDVDLEVAVLVSIHEVCKLKPKEHGEELLPMAISILELDTAVGTDTLVLTKRLALEVVNMCIKVNITDPRTMWTIHHAQFTNQLISSKTQAPDSLWIQICNFFHLVPQKAEDSEAYQHFKLDILISYLLPMLAISPPQQDGEPPVVATSLPISAKVFSGAVRSSAFEALSGFAPPELYPHFPTPSEFTSLTTLVPECKSWNQDEFHEGPGSLITALVYHEVENMRRAVFKALATDMGVNRDALATGSGGADDLVAEVGKAKRVLRDLGGDVRERWGLGKGAAAVRSGLAASTLYLPVGLLPEDVKTASSLLDTSTALLTRLPVYKDLINGLRDLSISDHPLTRVEAVSVWTCFWQSRLRAMIYSGAPKESLQKVDWLFRIALQELEKRLADTKQPGACATVIYAITGLMCAAVTLGVSSAAEHVTRVIRVLVGDYGRDFDGRLDGDSTAASSELRKSDEVQGAVCLGVAHLSRLLFSTDEESFGVVVARLKGELEFAVSDDTQSGFAAGYGLTLLLHSLIQSPSPIVSLIQEILALVAENIVDPSHVSSTAFLGLSLGLSNCLSDVKEYVEDSNRDALVSHVVETVVARFMGALGDNEGEVDDSTVNLIVGDVWIVGAVVSSGVFLEQEDGDEVVSVLEALVARAENDPNFTPCLTHARVSFNRILVSRSATSSAILAAVHGSLTRLSSKSNTPSPTKISIALGLSPLLGIDTVTQTVPSVSLYKLVTESIQNLLQASPAPEPKVSRILGWIQGQIFKAFETLFDVESVSQIDELLQASSGGGTFAQSKKKDPADYRRLNVGSSFLRATFDALSGLVGPNGTIEEQDFPTAKMLLSALVNLGKEVAGGKKPLGLPLVNWTRILTACFDSGDMRLKTLSFEMSLVHASHAGAKSLVDFFVAKMSAIVGDEDVRNEFAFRKGGGVEKLLELSGVCGNGSGVDGDGEVSVTVASSKVLEIIQAVVYFVYFESNGVGVDNMIKLSDVFHKCLNSSPKVGLPDSLVKLKTDIISLLCDAYLALPDSPDFVSQIVVVRNLIHTIIVSETPQTTSLLLRHLLYPETWNRKHIWALLHVLDFADSEAQWILTPHISKHFVNKDHLFVRVLQFLVSNSEESSGPDSCVAATLTFLHILVTKFKNRASHDDIDVSVFKLSWIVRYLDVLIISCASGNGSGVDVGWARLLSGALLVFGSDEKELLAVHGKEGLVSVNDEEWGAVEKVAGVTLVDLMMHGEDERVWKLQSQIAKRLLRLLECTITQKVLEKKKKQSSARVIISESTRVSIRDVLLRVRDLGEVCEGWMEVVGGLIL